MKPLTPRQAQIIEMRLQGLMHKEIARHLGISMSTVRNHMSGVYKRLDVPSQGRTCDKQRIVRRLVNGSVA